MALGLYRKTSDDLSLIRQINPNYQHSADYWRLENIANQAGALYHDLYDSINCLQAECRRIKKDSSLVKIRYHKQNLKRTMGLEEKLKEYLPRYNYKLASQEMKDEMVYAYCMDKRCLTSIAKELSTKYRMNVSSATMRRYACAELGDVRRDGSARNAYLKHKF
jgi:hypothetical protein